MSKLFIRWDEKSPVRISVFKRPSILQDVFEWKLRICPTVVITHSLHIFHANISVVCTFEIDAILSSTLKTNMADTSFVAKIIYTIFYITEYKHAFLVSFYGI